MMDINQFPPNILTKIFGYLPIKDLAENLVLVCKNFTNVCKEDKLLKKSVWIWTLWGEREVPPPAKSKTVYIGNIPKQVGEDELYEMVPNPDSVVSIRIISDKQNLQSPSYAYINFVTIEEAEKALALNFFKLREKRIICNFKQIETSKHNVCNVGNIYIDKIANRTPEIEEEMLADILNFGEIISLRVENKRAFIQFADKVSAIECILEMDQKKYGGIEIEVRPFVSRERRKVSKRIFLSGLKGSITREKLMTHFTKFGKVKDCNIFTVNDGEKMAWIEMPSDTAFKMLSKTKQTNLEGQTLNLSENMEQKHNRNHFNFREYFYSGFQNNVYVNNLHDTITEKDLHNCFARFGDIVSLKIERDEYQRSKGFAYICFREPQQALLSIENMNNQILPPGKKMLHVTIWQPKEVRSSVNASLHQGQNPFLHHNHNHNQHPSSSSPIDQSTYYDYSGYQFQQPQQFQQQQQHPGFYQQPQQQQQPNYMYWYPHAYPTSVEDYVPDDNQRYYYGNN